MPQAATARECNRADGMTLRIEKVSGDSPPAHIRSRLILARHLLERASVEPDRPKHQQTDPMALAMGIRLRNTGRITLLFDCGHGQKTKVIQTMRRADRPTPGVLTKAVFSKREAWMRTHEKAVEVINSMIAYGDFCLELLKAEVDPTLAVPECPRDVQRYVLRYTRWVYGSRFQDLRERLLRDRRSFPQDLDAVEGTVVVPTLLSASLDTIADFMPAEDRELSTAEEHI